MNGDDMARHMDIVRFKPKPELKERVTQVHRDFDLSSRNAALSLNLIDCGDWVCGVSLSGKVTEQGESYAQTRFVFRSVAGISSGDLTRTRCDRSH